MTHSIAKRLLLTGLLAVFLPACSSFFGEGSTNRDLTDTRVYGERMYVSGILNAQSYFEFKRQLRNNPQVTVLVLQDIEGSIDDRANLETAKLIRRHGLNTVVPANGEIYSGAVDLFCAGRERIVEHGAEIGVHAWDDGSISGDEAPLDSPAHDIFTDYYRDTGCPASFYWYSLNAAPSDDIHIMSEQELLREGVATEITG